ncbi:MAG: hypothetical protein AAF067_06625 [Pseudomonadota bacterium]
MTFFSDFFTQLPELVEAVGSTKLTIAAFLSIVIGTICYVFFKESNDWVKLVAFLSTMVFSFLIIIRLIGPNTELERDQKLVLVRLLSVFPPEERMGQCKSVAVESVCSEVVNAMRGLAFDRKAPALQKEAENALKAGLDSAESRTVISGLQQKISSDDDLVLSPPRSGGWNIDFFWCYGSGRERNISLATDLATKLSEGESIGTGMLIGQIRRRALPVERQSAFLKEGFEVRGEASESQMRDDLVLWLNEQNSSDPVFAARTSTQNTPNYLSVFVCSA